MFVTFPLSVTLAYFELCGLWCLHVCCDLDIYMYTLTSECYFAHLAFWSAVIKFVALYCQQKRPGGVWWSCCIQNTFICACRTRACTKGLYMALTSEFCLWFIHEAVFIGKYYWLFYFSFMNNLCLIAPVIKIVLGNSDMMLLGISFQQEYSRVLYVGSQTDSHGVDIIAYK